LKHRSIEHRAISTAEIAHDPLAILGNDFCVLARCRALRRQDYVARWLAPDESRAGTKREDLALLMAEKDAKLRHGIDDGFFSSKP
jgi:hypothetical protein